MGCKSLFVCSGGVTHWALCPDDEDDHPPPSPVLSRSGRHLVDPEGNNLQFKVMTVAWGQNANNAELGYGEGEPKSATKPQRVRTLDGVNVFEYVHTLDRLECY